MMKLSRWSALLLAATLLSACGKDSGSQQTASEPSRHYQVAVTLQGAVSDNNGPLKAGKIEARLPGGQLLAETTLENSARYRLEIPAGTELPLLLNYLPTKPGAEEMVSVAVQPGISKYDINPLTTAIAKRAKALGGYTLRNMTRAAEDTVHVPDANKTSTGFRGDPTTQYGGWH